MHYSHVLIFFIFASRANSADINQSAKISVGNSTTSDFGKCDQYVSELVLQLESDNGSPNTRQICKKVSDCYGTLEGDTARKLKKIYDFRCQKYDFYGTDMIYCFKRILQERDWGSMNNCPNMLSFTTIDLNLRRDYYNKYKSCIMNIANESCSSESFDYLNSNYNKFVDFLTIAPGNDSCESLHVELNRKQCEVNKEAAVNEWWLLEDYEREYKKLPMGNVVRGLKYCNKLKECNEDECNIISTVKQMKDYEFYNATVSYMYSCIVAYGSVHPVSVGNCTTSDRSCNKKVMAEKCGNETVEEFDKYFDWFNKYDLTKIEKLKIHGDYAQYEVIDTLENRFSFRMELGKCAPMAEKLVTLLSRKTTDGMKKYNRMTVEKCIEVKDCFGSLSSEGSKQVEKNYLSVCEKLDLKASPSSSSS